MKEAELSVALLNGFGVESTGTQDVDDARRRQRFRAKHKNKKHPQANQALEDSANRIRTRIQEKVAKQEVTPKDIFNIVLEERRRARKLGKGGIEAARIMASDGGQDENTDIKPGEVSRCSVFISNTLRVAMLSLLIFSLFATTVGVLGKPIFVSKTIYRWVGGCSSYRCDSCCIFSLT